MLASIKKALPFRLQQAIASQNLIGKSKAKNNQSIVLYNKNYDWRVEMGRQATHFPAVLKSPVT
jgi:hypothetical protein